MTSVQLKPNISITRVQSEVVLLDLDNGQYFGLNDVGCCVIDGLKQEHSIEQIAEGLVDQFAVDLDVALADIHALVDQLKDADLLALSQ